MVLANQLAQRLQCHLEDHYHLVVRTDRDFLCFLVILRFQMVRPVQCHQKVQLFQ